jgi:hypothetical protein
MAWQGTRVILIGCYVRMDDSLFCYDENHSSSLLLAQNINALLSLLVYHGNLSQLDCYLLLERCLRCLMCLLASNFALFWLSKVILSHHTFTFGHLVGVEFR